MYFGLPNSESVLRLALHSICPFEISRKHRVAHLSNVFVYFTHNILSSLHSHTILPLYIFSFTFDGNTLNDTYCKKFSVWMNCTAGSLMKIPKREQKQVLKTSANEFKCTLRHHLTWYVNQTDCLSPMFLLVLPIYTLGLM